MSNNVDAAWADSDANAGQATQINQDLPVDEEIDTGAMPE